MKFARYLQDTQTPEWKRAYIDYKGLKKRIRAIRRSQQGLDPNEPPSAPRTSLASNEQRPSDVHSENHTLGDQSDSNSPQKATVDVASRIEQEGMSSHQTQEPSPSRRRLSAWSRKSLAVQQGLPNIKWPKSRRPSWSQSRTGSSMGALPLHALLAELGPLEADFFAYLDLQLEKVESFYSSREKELVVRTQSLQDQMRELQNHKKLISVENGQTTSWTSAVTAAIRLKLRYHETLRVSRLRKGASGNEAQRDNDPDVIAVESDDLQNSARSAASFVSAPDEGQERGETTGVRHHGSGRHGTPPVPDPDTYLFAKKELRKAVLEHYRDVLTSAVHRVLELLHNYRTLNLTGFRKALKKFEKVTKIKSQEQYMTEKVDKSALGLDRTLQSMMKEMQELYAEAFFQGNHKKAMKRLRAGARRKTHHFSTFRSGFLIGIALPALAYGIYNSCLEKVHEEIPAWDALLFVYGVVSIPVFLSMLVGMNILVWAHARINYAFIFELDERTRLDYREYFEIPSFLFATLCYAFWLSFARIGSSHVSPTTWPLVWLGLTGGIMFNPLPFFFRPSRSWLLKNTGKLLISGLRPVEFTDFWLGDELCSMIFTLPNLYTFGCIYREGFQPDWHKCTKEPSFWPVAFVLVSLPFFMRLLQSIRRYVDSGLASHLINAGKYGAGGINYLLYYLWRNQEPHYGSFFVPWIICNTIYVIYVTSWDLLMDWSLLRPHAKHPFLRDELGYSNHIYLYYVAIVTNVVIRFSWVFYIPEKGPDMLLRSFIVGCLEMLRRVQWNFYRLENEHIGNMDQYRVTREVPLPYTFDNDDEDGDISETQSRTRSNGRS